MGNSIQPSARVIRMEKELAEITERCGKIRKFTQSEKWAKVNKLNQELLGAQYSAMQTYARVLNIRLKIAYGEEAREEARRATPSHPENRRAR